MAKGFFTMLSGAMMVITSIAVTAEYEGAFAYAVLAVAHAVLANAWKDG